VQRAAAQQLRVLAQPFLGRVEARDVVERVRRLEEVEQALALALDHVLLHRGELRGRELAPVVERVRDHGVRADARQAGQAAREHLDRQLAALGQVPERVRLQRAQVVEHLGFARQRDVELGGVRILRDQLVDVVETLDHEHGRDVGLHDRGIVGPAEHLDHVRAEFPAQIERFAARHDELGEVDHDRDARRLLAGEHAQVERAQQVAVEQLERLARLARRRERGGFAAQRLLQPGSEVVAALRRADPAAAVVVQDDVVAGEHHFVEERAQRQELAADRGDDVEHVAVDQELRDRARLEQVAHLLRPRRQRAVQLRRDRGDVGAGGAHCDSLAAGTSIGGVSDTRSST
jgi:hypothetical protein